MASIFRLASVEFLVIFSAYNYRHIIYWRKDDFKEKLETMIEKYQNLVGRNDMPLNDLNWSGDELSNFS